MFSLTTFRCVKAWKCGKHKFGMCEVIGTSSSFFKLGIPFKIGLLRIRNSFFTHIHHYTEAPERTSMFDGDDGTWGFPSLSNVEYSQAHYSTLERNRKHYLHPPCSLTRTSCGFSFTWCATTRFNACSSMMAGSNLF